MATVKERGTFVGRYFVTKGQAFHSDVSCSQLASAQDVVETTIVEDGGNYYRAGHFIMRNLGPGHHARAKERWKFRPCARCHPLDEQFKLEPLGTDDVPCAGSSLEWVTERTKLDPVEKIFPAQRECMNCPVVDSCYELFRKELPEYGVMGGVTYKQYKAWGDDVLDLVRAMIKNEDQQTEQRDATTRNRGNTR